MPEPSAARARWPRHGLYAITDGPRADLCEVARAALEGGAAVLQYRDKTRDPDRRLREARALVKLCRPYGVPLIVNDDVELARAAEASGVHLGEDDRGIAEARSVLGSAAIVGVSCYDSLERARSAAAAGADYLAFGAFFPTRSKTVSRYATPERLREAGQFGLPRVAIGGITADNGGSLIAAGADFLAAISGVFGASDVRAQARRFAMLFDTDRGAQPGQVQLSSAPSSPKKP